MEFNKNYGYKVLLSIVIGMIFIVLFMYASPTIPTQWAVHSKNYMQHSLRTIISNSNKTERLNTTLFSHKSNISSNPNKQGQFTNLITNKQSNSPSKSKSIIQLSDYLFNFPWTKFQASIKSPEENLYRQKLIDGLKISPSLGSRQ